MTKTADVAVIILTLNEEDNIAQALESVKGWAKQMVVLDSGSDDATCRIASAHGAEVFYNKFQGYSSQRNHALSLPLASEWVLFLDADEVMTEELKAEISEAIASRPVENGFLIKRRFIWLDTWVRRGYYPVWILRLFRKDQGRFEREINEHASVAGKIGKLKNDFLHVDRKSSERWFERHIKYARMEALAYLDRPEYRMPGMQTLMKDPVELKKAIRNVIWDRMPLFLRPFVYFSFRTFLQGGILDGRAAFLYHLFQGLFYPLMIDLFIAEERQRREKGSRISAATEVIDEPPNLVAAS